MKYIFRDDAGGLLDWSEIIGTAFAVSIFAIAAWAVLLAVPAYGG